MNTVEMRAKLSYVFEGLAISKEQKEALSDIYITLMEAALEGVNPDMTQYLKKTDDLPIGTANKAGGVKSKTTGTTSGKDYYIEILSDGTMKVNVPWTDNNTTYSAATSAKLGLVKQAATVAALEAEDEIATVISRINTLISNLKTAGVVANS